MADAYLTAPLIQDVNTLINQERGNQRPLLGPEELMSPMLWPEEAHDMSSETPASKLDTVISCGAKEGEMYEQSDGLCSGIVANLKLYLCDSHWPLSCFLAVAFLGFWLPKKRKSIWPLAFVPVVHLLFGLGAHFYFILSSNHRSIHIGSKMLLTSLWISGFSSYVIALYYFRYQPLEWIRELTRRQFRAVNVALLIGSLLVSWVLFGDIYYQVIFDLVNIKKTLLENCKREVPCNAIFYALAASVYWGLYSSVSVCCVFFALCLVMTNDMSKTYERISKCTGDVRDTLTSHRQLRVQIGERIQNIKTWFLIHMVFYAVVLLANIFEWWEATQDLHLAYDYMAQISGTLVVLYKFFFPFTAASYVTWHESTLVQDLNDKVDFQPGDTFYSRQDLELFLQQSRRRGYGFRVFKIQITMTIAIFSLLGSTFGLAHNLMKSR